MNLGIIGYRGFGAFCTEALATSDLGTVVAFAGRDGEAMQTAADRYGVRRIYTDYRELIADPTVEFVHISTPPDQHSAMAVAAIDAGKHIFVEKPLAVDEPGAQAIVAALLRSPGVVAGINYVMRYSPLYNKVKQIARHGLLGRLTYVDFQNYASDEALGDDHWFWKPEQSGGIFVEHGVHFFDIVGSIIGTPAREVRGTTWRRAGERSHEDRVHALVTYEDGVTASYYHAFNRPGILERQTAHFAFERGHITLHGWTPTRISLDAIVDADAKSALEGLFPNLSIISDNVGPLRGGGRIHDVRFRVQATEDLGDPTQLYKSAVRAAFEDVIKAAGSAGTYQPRVTIADGITSLRVALAAREASLVGHAVSI